MRHLWVYSVTITQNQCVILSAALIDQSKTRSSKLIWLSLLLKHRKGVPPQRELIIHDVIHTWQTCVWIRGVSTCPPGAPGDGG